MFRKLLKFLGISLLLIGLITSILVFAANRYLASNKTKILDQLPFLNEGTISFDETSISLYKNFPEATITLKNVWVKDSLFDQHQHPLLQVEKLHTAFSIVDIWHKKIAINQVQLENGVIHILTQQNGYSNVKNLLKKQLSLTEKPAKEASWKSVDVKTKALGLSLTNIAVHLTNAVKTTNIHTKINHLSTFLDLEMEHLAAQIELDLAIDQLIFKEVKGAFLPNSQLQGTFDFVWKDSSVVIQPFDLKINEETFLFSGEFYTKGVHPSNLLFENKATRLAKISPLLIPNIQKVLAPYEVPAPFYSKTKLITTFQPEDHPIIEVDFQFQNQEVTVFDIPFKQTSVKGRFLNRIYEDERQLKEGKKRFSLDLENVATRQGQFNIQAAKVDAWKTPEIGLQLKTAANISGEAKGISDWLGNNQFLFESGTFNLDAAINGSLEDINSILRETNAQLDLQDFAVVYQPANVRFPFREMTLEKEAGAAAFKIVNSSFQHDLWLNGHLKNIPALLIALAEEKAEGQALIESKKLSWTDFLNFFAENGLSSNGKSKSEKEKKKSMKTTVKGLYHNFEPIVVIEIDTLAYFDLLRLDNFKSGLYFEDEHTLILEKTNFDYEEGAVSFSGRLDIRHPHRTPFEFELTTNKLNLAKALPTLNYLNINMLRNLDHLPDDLNLTIQHKGILDDEKGLIPNSSTGKIAFDSHKSKDLVGTITYQPDTTTTLAPLSNNIFGAVHIALAGNPKVFNSFFKTDQFFFKDGQFEVAFDYKGNVKNIKELLSDGNAAFSLKESEVYYQPVGVTFPLTEIDLKLEADKASFDFYLLSDSLREKIHLTGNIDHLSELLLGQERTDLASEVNIAASKITWTQFLAIFASNDSTAETESMKATVKGILQTFNPHFHVQVDSFIYSNQLVFEALSTGVHLRDSTTIILEKTNFDFHNGHILVDGQFDVGQKLITPFAANIQTENLVLKELIESLNYLSLPSLKNMAKLGGAVSMNFDIAGVIDDYKSSLIPNATEGKLVFDLQDVVVIGFEPLDAIASRLRMEKRFQELRFAPIIGELTIKGEEINFPQLEIQSNAIHLFMEGTLSYGDLTDIWVSIPLNNLKRTNRYIIPKKTGYAASKRKVYIEVTSDENGDNQFKFRLFKRRFYRTRGILEQYKIDKKRGRAIRKALRKSKKKATTIEVPLELVSEQ